MLLTRPGFKMYYLRIHPTERMSSVSAKDGSSFGPIGIHLKDLVAKNWEEVANV